MSGLSSGMTLLAMYWQDALSFAVLALAAGSLLIRTYRNATRQRLGAGCGACSASWGNPGGGGCPARRGAPLPRSDVPHSPPPSCDATANRSSSDLT